jgi:serine/threonine-protein kinase SRPK3
MKSSPHYLEASYD